MQEEIRRSSASAGFANAGAVYNAILITAVHNSLGIRCDIILPILPSRSVSGPASLCNLIPCDAMIDGYPAVRSGWTHTDQDALPSPALTYRIERRDVVRQDGTSATFRQDQAVSIVDPDIRGISAVANRHMARLSEGGQSEILKRGRINCPKASIEHLWSLLPIGSA